MADAFVISVQVGADLDELEQKLAEAGTMAGAFADILAKTASTGSQAAAKAHGQGASEADRAWNSTAKSIENSMNTTIGSVLRGTISFKAGLDKVAVGIEQRFLSMALRIPEDWASSQLRMLVLSESGEASKTATAASGAATRNAIGDSENTSLFGRIGAAIAEWLGLETGKTAASTAGTTARTTEDTAANSAALIATKAVATSNAASWAAVAAVAASASVAAIPLVGWEMAPEVAAATYANGMVYAALASAAGGWAQVPQDGMMTELHKDEMVLPASIATPLRQSLAQSQASSPRPSLAPSQASSPRPSLAPSQASSPRPWQASPLPRSLDSPLPPSLNLPRPQSLDSPPSDAAGQVGGATHFHFAPTVSAVDASGIDQLLQQHQDIFIKNVRNWHRNGKLGPKGAGA